MNNTPMNRFNSIFILALVFTSLTLMSCNSSVKGKWSEMDKTKFQKDMAGIPELANFGEDKDKWIACYLEKCEATFSSYASADSDEAGCEKLAIDCSTEILSNGSVVGKWSETDKQKFRDEMNGIRELDDLGELKIQWVDCYMKKCEANYSSFFEANTDEAGCEKLALACSNELFFEDENKSTQ